MQMLPKGKLRHCIGGSFLVYGYTTGDGEPSLFSTHHCLNHGFSRSLGHSLEKRQDNRSFACLGLHVALRNRFHTGLQIAGSIDRRLDVTDLAIKEMPIEERYDKLLESYLLNHAINYALHKELGVVTKYIDFYVKIQKKMVPSYFGTAFKVFKTLSPGKAFKQQIKQIMNIFQETQPLSNMELTWISDREVIIKTENCVVLDKMRKLVKNAGLDINPRFLCGIDTTLVAEMTKEFGVNTIVKKEKNGCITTIKLK